MISLLTDNPILTLFLIMALGYLLGRIKIGSFSLGVAGALFAGIIVSALHPGLALPPLVYMLGLILFIYTTGISLGPTFFAGLRSTGLRDNSLTLSVIVLGASLIVAAALALGVDGALATGLYTGTFTVTPALAGVLDALGGESAIPIVGYSLAYPFSIVVSLLLISGFRRLWAIDAKEADVRDTSINPHTIHYLRKKPVAVAEVADLVGANITISRISSGGKMQLPDDDTLIRNGDFVTVVGTPNDYEMAVKWMGEKSPRIHLEAEQGQLHERRVFISDIRHAGRTVGQLKLHDKFHIVVTRVRRGDIDMVVHDDFVVELGDRMRIVGLHADIDAAAEYLGDSYQSVSHFNVLSLAVGISLGILLGEVTVPLPGGQGFSLGAAGGVIVVSLLLGAMRRTGPIVWQIPFSTNLSLRQLGLLMFLAGVGSVAGGEFVEALSDPTSYQLIAVTIAVAAVSVVTMIVVGHKILRIPYSRLSGMVAAMNTQPATLAFANDQTKTDEANIGYASVYPLALIAKIVIAQVLLIILL